MSIAVGFVARTGIVLGTDSRVTWTHREGKVRVDAYPKLIQFDDWPIALAMTGTGSYGNRDFRSMVSETYRAHFAEATVAPTVEEVVLRFAETATEIARQADATESMTVIAAGYSPGKPFGEMWETTLPSGSPAKIAGDGQSTITWRGRTRAVLTLWWGSDEGPLRQSMKEAGIDDDVAKRVVEGLRAKSAWGPKRLFWGMPLSHAIELIRFQLEVQITYERFMPGQAGCGAPTQLVAINDAGLQWIDAPFGDLTRLRA